LVSPTFRLLSLFQQVLYAADAIRRFTSVGLVAVHLVNLVENVLPVLGERCSEGFFGGDRVNFFLRVSHLFYLFL
jgi:hypothetical protein